jgi:hypothetical protein
MWACDHVRDRDREKPQATEEGWPRRPSRTHRQREPAAAPNEAAFAELGIGARCSRAAR